MKLPQVYHIVVLALTFLQGMFEAKEDIRPSFEQNYEIVWSGDHISSRQHGRELQLSLDENSGSGVRSRLTYYSGFFHMRLKLPGNDSAGVVTTFYVSKIDTQLKVMKPEKGFVLFYSQPTRALLNLKRPTPGNSVHFCEPRDLKSPTSDYTELDFEFLGNRKGKPYILQTNVFAHDHGDREQRMHLWFDPTADFHSYRLLWNQHHIVFFIDDKPIRIFKNESNAGVNYPTEAMHVIATIWNGDGWATDGGKEKINWTGSPFRYHLQSFGIDGCPSNNSAVASCDSTRYRWNTYRNLTTRQLRAYEHVKRKYMIYDYCTDRSRFDTIPPECPLHRTQSPVGGTGPRVPVFCNFANPMQHRSFHSSKFP